MANFDFNPSEYMEIDFPLVPEGKHRVRIADVVEGVSKSSGNPMYTITLDVSGMNTKLWYYLVITPDAPDKTNQRFGTFFDCFGITDKRVVDGIEKTWVGKVGGAIVAHEDYNGDKTAKVKYLLSRKKQENLPAWKEPNGTATFAEVPDASDLDIPF